MPNWTLQRLLRIVKNAPDRFGHRSRRRVLLEELRTWVRPKSILVVCHGNLCRSPFAAAILRRRLEANGLQIGVQSAGFSIPNRAPPAEALAAASDRGVDMKAHRSEVVNRARLDAADLVVVMDPRQALAVTARQTKVTRRVVVLGDLDPRAITDREVVDPFGKDRAAFDECYARIDRCVEELVTGLIEQRPSPHG